MASGHARMPSLRSPEEIVHIKICICGDGGCGKSSITLRIVRDAWSSEYDPTIEDSYSVTRTVDGKIYTLTITDTAGQEEYRSMWAQSNLQADAFLLVYDITSPDSLECLEHYTTLISMEEEMRKDRGAVLPVKMIVGNKCDLKEDREVTAQMGLDWARKKGCGFMETSAREMVNIEETFSLCIKRVVEARRNHVQYGYDHAPITLLSEQAFIQHGDSRSTTHSFLKNRRKSNKQLGALDELSESHGYNHDSSISLSDPIRTDSHLTEASKDATDPTPAMNGLDEHRRGPVLRVYSRSQLDVSNEKSMSAYDRHHEGDRGDGGVGFWKGLRCW